MRVRIPELRTGPPLERWRRSRVVDVEPGEVEALVAQGGEVLDEPEEKEKPPAKKKPAKQ